MRKAEPQTRALIAHALSKLADNPKQISAKKLVGEDAFRIRVRDYRILYEICDNEIVILVIRIGHRREVYRK